MPIYDYKCKDCNNHFEKMIPMSQHGAVQTCPLCSGESERAVGAYAPNIGDPVRLGLKKPSDGFRDLLRNIDAKTPGSILKNNSSYI